MMSSLSSLRSSSSPEEGQRPRFEKPGVPREKKRRLTRRGGTRTGKDDRDPSSSSPTMNTFVWNASLEEILRFMCGRIPSSALKNSTIREMVSPPEQVLAMYLGLQEPVEPQINAFIRKRWARIYDFMMNPLPGIILQAQVRTENIPSIEQGPKPSQRFSKLDQSFIAKKLQKQKGSIEQAKHVEKVANSLGKTVLNYDAEVLEAMRQKLLDRIQRIIQCFRQDSRITRRSAAAVYEIIKDGKVPSDFIRNIEPEVIGLFINELGILRVRQKGQRPPKIVLNTFTS